MEGSGLHTSIWATERDKYFRRSGDWVCPSCDFLNFQRRTECFRCSSTATGAGAGAVPMTRHGLPNAKPSEIDYPGCELDGDCDEVLQYSSQGHTTVGSSEDSVQHVQRESVGLTTSRWAPRYRSRSSNMSDDIDIWTRVIPAIKNPPNSYANTKFPTPDTPPLDLGLPYEVQHYILSLMQRLLEEACYDFASRWIPHTLSSNNWTCAEAVELSTWRKTLPTILPSNAIVPIAGYSLDSALADAVRIRNNAVHRHLCTNGEIRSMASKAQDLMAMFADRMRQSKFHRLWTELGDWDAWSRVDGQEAKVKLQQALQEIGECEMDEMDWTPNAVSLREITGGEDVEPSRESEDFYVDEMEVD